jgi:hypothetical protein
VTAEHQATRAVKQPPDVVHDRLIELVGRLREEMPPISSNDQVARLLGVDGALGIEIKDDGPGRIDVATTEGRIRVRSTAELTATSDGGTSLALGVALEPDGFAGRMMLGAATSMVTDFDRQFRDGVDRIATELAEELSKPDGEWSVDDIAERLSR